ncbi:hypothetical protein TWF106_008397 [Orbilia oligospora]|uniref:Uncharacterized protein n=2 Tax=Orbilia oligospora TaxID=2813651 RepID=A0A6G1MH08_ORBOL|nr:hypothetical protein TWF788_002655 [Orbilia oligospora]KAF3199020.1 hypothetical protein TWF679_001683 [Orbilia oligospora]KAF3227993.1 hypothetical protein TWF106_008397 [Orbilia oligospora]KAF3257559.1 hypothetical protein TWF192_000852 [Orbilia oligospora]
MSGLARPSPSSSTETLPSRKVLQLLSRSSRYVRIYLGEIDVDWRHYQVPKWVVTLPNGRKQPVNWSSSSYQKTEIDWTGRLIGSEGHLNGPYDQYQQPEGSPLYPVRFEKMHPSFKVFDPMPPDRPRDFKSAKEWKQRFCNPHTFLGQTQQAAVQYFLADNLETSPPKLIDPTAGCRFMEVMVDHYPIFCSLIEVCELDSLLLLMSICKYIRRRILDSPMFWKEINITAYTVDRSDRVHRDYRFDTVSEVVPGRAGKWTGSPLHVLSGLKKHEQTAHWIHRSCSISYEERVLSSLPLASLTKLTLDGSDIHWNCWYQILGVVLQQLTFLSVRWCRSLSLGSISFDVLGHYLEEAQQRRPVTSTLNLMKPCKLKTLLVWGVRGEGHHNSRRYNESRDRDIQILYDSAGSSRFRTNGNGVKSLYIQYCKVLGIKTDYGACSATGGYCWNEEYIKEGNFDYGMVDMDNTTVLGGNGLTDSNVEPRFAAPGYLAARTCNKCDITLESHICRECEEARTCYICLRYVCIDCDRKMTFATRPLDWRPIRTKTALPEYMPHKYCVSNCCNYCTNAGRYVCVECNFQSQEEARKLLLSNCTGCTCNHMPEDFCPIRIPIDTQSERHGKKHLTVCGMDDCDSLIVACKNCDNGRDVMDYGQRCSACAIPVCWTCARTPCPYCPTSYERLCPKCVVQHTCTCYHSVRRTSKRKRGKSKGESDEAKPSNRKTHQPGCPLRDVQTQAELPLTTTLRYHDRYILPGGEVRTERGLTDMMNNVVRWYPKVKLEPACDDCGIAWWIQPRHDDVPVKRRRRLLR